MRLLDKYKVLDYLSEYYETLHTQSSQWILEDIDEFIRLRKEKGACPYEGGLISKQLLIAELKTYKLVDQYLFHTERALQSLKFIEAKEVKK